MVIVVNINRKWMWGISSLILSLFSVVFEIHDTFIFPFYSIVCWRVKQRIVKFAYKTKGLLHDVYLILSLWVPATMCRVGSAPWDKRRGGSPGSATDVLIQFLFFSFSSFDGFSYFRTLIIIMIIIINIRSFHTVSFLRDRADHFKVVGLKNLAVFCHLSCIRSPSYLPS